MDKSLEKSGIISYSPRSEFNINVSGFYFNEDTEWYEIWWHHKDLDVYSEKDYTMLVASTKYPSTMDNLLLESLAHWTGRMNKALENIVKH